jgi:hypothetical protein
MGWGNTKPNASWFKLGSPRVVCPTCCRRSRCSPNSRYAYNGKGWVDIEPQGQPSKWVTLRACTVLLAVYGP